MENYIQDTSKKHKKVIDKIISELTIFSKPLFESCNYSDTTSYSDCSFLSLLILEYKPKNIMEIGTWVGTTSYAMTSTSKDVTVYTCDNNDRFVNLNLEQNNRIKIHPKTYSTEFLKNLLTQNIKFDMIFNDASISEEDCKMMCDLSNNEFIFATHDFYNSIGEHEKGYHAMETMKKILNEKNIKYFEYIPQKEWYFENRINACSGLLICSK